MQAACSLLADPNLTGTDLLDAMSQAADVLLANASTAIVGCLDTSGFNTPTFNFSWENVNAWEYQVGLVVASAAYRTWLLQVQLTACNVPSYVLPIASSQAVVETICKPETTHSWTWSGCSCPPSLSASPWGGGVCRPTTLGCFVVQVCTQLPQPNSYDGGELTIRHVSHRYSRLQRWQFRCS